MQTTAALPIAGTWVLDPSHTTIGFVARHLVVTKVRGRFTSFTGTVEVADPIERSSVEVEIDAASITTDDGQRDPHLRSPDFLDVARFPALRFRSTEIAHRDGDRWTLRGELTIRDVTRPIELEVEHLGVVTDPWGNQKAGVTATAELDREAFGMTWNQALEAGGVLVGRTVRVEIEAQLARGD